VEQLLTTKFYIPPTRQKLVPRPRLIEQLNEGLNRRLTLISAPAGFGKTTLVSEWVQAIGGTTPPISIAWLSLDEGDNDPTRFLTYFIAALNRVEGIEAAIGGGALNMLQSPQPPPSEVILTSLINEVSAIPSRIILILDDYQLIESLPVNDILTFLVEHLPPQMHLVIATRDDPQLPMSRLRGRGQLTELRATDLRFTSSEAAEFLNQGMGLDLSAEDIAALETRTEGWIAGLQLAAISMQGNKDATGFIKSFTGSHRFVLDYLIEEVLDQQSERVKQFLLQTAILDRLTGSLCNALTGQEDGQATLEMLDRANLFIIPLDNERRWYRYHHLFADLLRLRLQQQQPEGVSEYHIRASQWYEDNGLEIEAFQHAAAANDIERAERLIEGKGMPLHFRGAVVPVLNWLASLPTTVLDAWPSLWTSYASVLLVTGQAAGVEQALQAAEAALAAAALQGAEPDDKSKDLVGRIAAIRATMAANYNQVETIIAESRRALEHLHPDNLAFRTSTAWKLGYAYQIQGNRAAAGQAYTEVISIGQASGNMIFTLVAKIGLGSLQELENQLYLAAESYRHVIHFFGDQPLPFASEAYLGLARISYEWNDLDAAQQYAQQSVQLMHLVENTDRTIASEVFLARLKLAQGDVPGAAIILAKASETSRQYNFVNPMPEVAAVQVLVLLRQGNLAGAADLAEAHKLPISQARVYLAQGNPSKALAVLESLRRQAEAKGWQDERLKVMVLQAVALHAHGEKDQAVQLLGEALALAEPGGFVRTFIDGGPPMARLLYEALSRGISPDYVGRLLEAFPSTEPEQTDSSQTPTLKFELIEPLSEREIEVLQLIAEGLTNREIATRLYLSLNTVKVHTRNINGKLDVSSRMKAVARARALGILPSI
jgi:LuxR family maltose regulon positive regulatory protein